jgi:hypothetical protein
MEKFATGGVELTSTRGQLWNLLEDKTLCDGFDPERQQYTSRRHLAQLIGFIGHHFLTKPNWLPDGSNPTVSRIDRHHT